MHASRQWRSFGDYIDITANVGNLQALSLTWTLDRDASGGSSNSYQTKKSASGSLSLEGEAYELVKKWLIEDVSAPLNAVAVKVYDSGCGIYYDNYQIQAKDVRYCENEICSFDVTLKQQDEVMSCIKSTLVGDNWQGWFSAQPAGGKKHPRFSYCNEIRPNGQLVAVWKLGTWNFMVTNTILFVLIAVYDIIVTVINAIIWVIRRFTKKINYIKTVKFGDVLDTQEQTFIESAGCGREHPAPLIRDYIANVCGRCGVHVDADTAPIFFKEYWDIETSTRGIINTKNPHYNACYFYAPLQRGIRRVSLPSPFLAPDFNDTDYYIPDNAPVLALDQMLDELKQLYNAEWHVYNGKLYFQRKDFYLDENYAFDFSSSGADRNKIIEGICFDWNETKYPASTRGLYQQDSVDTCGNEARKHTDSSVNHGSTDDNPNYEGFRDIMAPFGAAKFRCDGASTDYIYDAAQLNINGGIFASIFKIMNNVMDELNKTCRYALLLKDDTCTLPKVLIWDGVSYDAAHAVRDKSAYDPNAGALPTINVPYNNYPTPQPWPDRHPLNNFVKGSNTNPHPFPKGYYTLRSWTGGTPSQQPALLVNYPMFFASEFEDSMWDWFHWIDDPRRNPTMNQNWNLKIELCCDDLQTLGVKDDGADAILGQKVKLPAKYYGDGRIKEITVSYDPKNERGAYIELKGTN
ncbi:MAG: hypothetical protein EOP51_04080 [Sphingobacteriales bacterium]|nr:MAG: hypothetical protein EOP51_04080 [Sphingobacteriales bacterium]